MVLYAKVYSYSKANHMTHGLLNLSMLGLLSVVFLLTQITIISVTVYLHRCQSHRALDLHPIISHFFRFWLWLTTGMVTKEWVAIHRKHHAHTDAVGDPHSPKLYGIKKVLLEGSELYRDSAKDKAMIEKYAHGTPNDWIENQLYSRFPILGVSVMLIIDLLLFGVIGLTVWAVQMLWIPFHAAGIVNGVGHYLGYRNFETQDVSRNMFPWGFWIGGEELHNNHHAFASSAKFSVRWWEFDIGWMVIRVLSLFRLATVKKRAPRLLINENKATIDIDTVKALIANRLQIMTDYYRQVFKPLIQAEKQRKQVLTKDLKSLLRASRHLLIRSEATLTETTRERLEQVLVQFERLKIAYFHGKNLQNIWMKTATSQRDIVESLQNWCKQAEASGLDVLKQFADQIKHYVPAPAH